MKPQRHIATLQRQAGGRREARQAARNGAPSPSRQAFRGACRAHLVLDSAYSVVHDGALSALHVEQAVGRGVQETQAGTAERNRPPGRHVEEARPVESIQLYRHCRDVRHALQVRARLHVDRTTQRTLARLQAVVRQLRQDTGARRARGGWRCSWRHRGGGARVALLCLRPEVTCPQGTRHRTTDPRDRAAATARTTSSWGQLYSLLHPAHTHVMGPQACTARSGLVGRAVAHNAETNLYSSSSSVLIISATRVGRSTSAACPQGAGTPTRRHQVRGNAAPRRSARAHDCRRRS